MVADGDDFRRALWMRRLLALATLVLMITTWPLWQGGGDFPQIPWGRWACRWPLAFDRIALAGLWGAIVGLLGLRDRRQIARALGLFCAALSALIVVDQHRLQPWAWQFLLVAALLGLADEPAALRWLRYLTVSVYVYSSLSKVDAAFLAERGPWLVDGLLHAIGTSTALWSARQRGCAAAVFPAGEMLVAVALLIPRTRRLGLYAAIALHLLLLLTLGPLGYNHKPGVLLWNAFFLLQDWLLFGPLPRTGARSARTPDAVPKAAVPAEENASRNSPRAPGHMGRGLAAALAISALTLPILEPLGWFDHWPAWSVYSERPAIAAVFVDRALLRNLPVTLQPFVGDPEPLTDWCRVNFDAWSFGTQSCPIYPQLRYRLALAHAVADEARLGDGIRIRVQSSPDRRTGQRSSRELRGTDAIRAACSEFWINTQPRRRSPPGGT